MLMSTLKPTSGRIDYFGQSLETAREAILGRVGFASAYSKLPLHLTIDENLDVFGRLYGLSRRRSQGPHRELLDAVRRLGPATKRTMAGLSAGQTTRVMLAKAFLARPRIVLLDEPTASLDPDIAHEVREFVCEAARPGRGVDPLHLAQHGRGRPDLRPGPLPRQGQDRRRRPARRAGGLGRRDPDPASASTAGSITCSATRPSAGLATRVDDGTVDVEIDEHQVAEFLSALAALDVRYTEIHLDKPTLEDYFLKLARRRTGAEAERG